MESGVYRHYKGGFYQVLGIAQHSETDELVVVYVSLDASLSGPRMRVRPLYGVDGFLSGAPSGDGLRFEYCGDEVPSGFRPYQPPG